MDKVRAALEARRAAREQAEQAAAAAAQPPQAPPAPPAADPPAAMDVEEPPQQQPAAADAPDGQQQPQPGTRTESLQVLRWAIADTEAGTPADVQRLLQNWRAKPIDWDPVNWRTVAHISWTHAPEGTPEADRKLKNDYYGIAREYLIRGRDFDLPKYVDHGTARKRFKEQMRWFRYDAQLDRVFLVDYAVHPMLRDKATGQPLVVGTGEADKVHVYMVLPNSRVLEFLHRFYTHPEVNAHRGRDTFYDKIVRHVVGVTRQMVNNFIQNQESKQVRGDVMDHRVTNPLRPKYPFHHWQMDLFDMTFAAGSNKDYRWVLVVIDCFSKFIYLRTFKQKEGLNVASELQRIFMQDGPPKILQSDNGKEFRNEDVQRVCAKFNVEQRFGREYKPQSQGQVERTNRTIKNAIYADFERYQSQRWVDWLAHYAFSYNCMRHSTTGFTPFEVHRGRQVMFMTDTASHTFNFNEAAVQSTEGEIVARLRQEMRDAWGGGGPDGEARLLAEPDAQGAPDVETALENMVRVRLDLERISPPLTADETGVSIDRLPEYFTGLNLFVAQYQFSARPRDYAEYVVSDARCRGLRQREVSSRINRGADMMVNKYLVKNREPPRIGDRVRLNLNSLKSRSCKIKKKTPSWSPELYVVTGVVRDDNPAMMGCAPRYRVRRTDFLDAAANADERAAQVAGGLLVEGWQIFTVPGLAVGDVVRFNLETQAAYKRMFGCIVKNRGARWSRALYRISEVLDSDAVGAEGAMAMQMPGEPDDIYLQRMQLLMNERRLASRGFIPQDASFKYRLELFKPAAGLDVVDEAGHAVPPPREPDEDEAEYAIRAARFRAMAAIAGTNDVDERDDTARNMRRLYDGDDLFKVDMQELLKYGGWSATLGPDGAKVKRPVLDFGQARLREDTGDDATRVNRRVLRELQQLADGGQITEEALNGAMDVLRAGVQQEADRLEDPGLDPAALQQAEDHPLLEPPAAGAAPAPAPAPAPAAPAAAPRPPREKRLPGHLAGYDLGPAAAGPAGKRAKKK